MTKIRVGWAPPDKLIQFLRSLATRLSDFEPVMRVAADLFWSDIRGNIETRGRGLWAAHAQSTEERSRRGGRPWNKKGSHDPLRLSDRLYNSITRDWGSTYASAYTAAPHAHFADVGTQRHSVGGKSVSLYQASEARAWLRAKSAREAIKFPGGTFRRSKSETATLRRTKGFASSMHEPQREFMYELPETRDRIYKAVVDYALRQQQRVA